jgi:D-arabinose 1-dehydrogenase-like Zn-dependent alcohol dehydrogenase
MTTGPSMPFSMNAVLKNIDIRGTTMGSRKEFADMIKFVNQEKLKPVVSRVVTGFNFDDLDPIDDLFEDMKAAKQFGKLAIEFQGEESASKL